MPKTTTFRNEQVLWKNIKSTLSTSNTVFQISKKTDIPVDVVLNVLNNKKTEIKSQKFNKNEYFVLKTHEQNPTKIILKEAFDYLKFD